MIPRLNIFQLCVVVLSFFAIVPAAFASTERPVVAYTGVYLMGNKLSENKFPVYMRNQKELVATLRIEMKKVHEQGKLPFDLMFETDMKKVNYHIDNTLSLAFVVVRDDVAAESFSANSATINKTIINVGLVAIIYDTRKIEGKDRNTVVFSFPLVGYSQRLDGDRKSSDSEIDSLFVKTAATALRENLVKRLAGVKLSEIYGDITDCGAGTVTVNIGSTDGIDDGQKINIITEGQPVAGTIVKLDRKSAVVELPNDFKAKPGMKVKATNMRADSNETFQVVKVKVSSQKAAKLFPQEVIGPQAAQWFSNFLTDRSGKVVLPSREGGEWDQRATYSAFTLMAKDGTEHQFELPPPKYPVTLDITGISSKVTDSNDVNDICMFKVWIKVSIPSKKYEKEFDIFSSKSLIKGVQSFEEKNEFFDLLYQLTAKIAREAAI